MEIEFSRLIDALPGMVWTALPDGRAELLNRRWCDYTGLRPDQSVDFGWQAAIHPDDLGTVLERWRSCLDSGQTGEIEARLRRYDGEYRRFLSSVAPMADEAGGIVRWCGINTDIEEHTRTEEAARAMERTQADVGLKARDGELREALDRLAEAQRLSKTGSFTWDVAADDHNWSEEVYRLFGFDIGVKVTIAMIQAAIHPEDISAVESVIAGMLQGAAIDLVFRIVTPGGEVRYAHVVAHRTEQITDRLVFIGALQDVTERKVAEEALNKARADLTHVARVTTLSALTASIAHEVNQPLSGILTNASTCLRMLAADPPNLDGARTTAQRTIRDANRASEVIQRLRTLFTRSRTNKEPVDLNDATREVLALSSSELQRHWVMVRTDFADDLPPVAGDRVQLQQVILNLVLNAAEAMTGVNDRPRELLVATAFEEANRLRLSVRDAGVGIDPQNIEKLFNAFHTTKPHGMGIGLSISRSIIESHGGRLWASANDGPGMTFSFSIPCSAPLS